MSSVWDWKQLVVYVVGMSPWLLVLLIGAGLCLRHAGDQRRRTVFIGIALAIQFGDHMFSLLGTAFLWTYMRDKLGSIELVQLVIGFLHWLPNAAALLLMLYAAFYGDPRPSEAMDDHG